MIMKTGTIVKFKDVVDAGDENIRMLVLEDSDRERVLVEALVGMNLNPTYRYNVKDLEVCDTTYSAMLQ
jgi:hypothetical protein